MGSIGKRNGEKKVYTERDIQKKLGHFMSEGRYRIENLFVYRWESDYLYITKSDYSYEIEIKISRSDFFNDKKKEEKHKILEGKYEIKKYEKEYPQRPNYFYYAVPKDLVTAEEVPEYAGLLYIVDYYPYVEIIKQAPKIHSDKFDIVKLKLTDKFYYNYIEWKRKAEEGFEDQVTTLKKKLDEAKTIDGKKYKYTLPEAHKQIDILDNFIKTKDDFIKTQEKELGYRERLIRYLKDLLYEKGMTITEMHNKMVDFRKTEGEIF